jgi:SAM-dependent methyltransferase
MDIYVYQDKVSPPEKKLKNLDYDWTGKSVLDLGCNIGKLGVYVKGKGAEKYKGIDWDKNMIKLGVERYGLDLEAKNVLTWEDYDYDVVVAMALFHHFTDKQLNSVLSKITAKELIFEVPVGNNDVGLYQIRTKEWYKDRIEEIYGKVIDIIRSGATNDPYNQRVIFYCKKYGKVKCDKRLL